MESVIGADTDSAWCDRMVAWMDTHMGDSDNWMSNGPTTMGG
jgi:hypothetical protein